MCSPLNFAVRLAMRSVCRGMALLLLLVTVPYALVLPPALAQTAGTIRYQRTVKPEIPEDFELPPALREMQEEILASMSAVDTTVWRLHFTEKASVMMATPDSAAIPGRSVNRSRGDVNIRIRTRGRLRERTVTYTDLEAWTVTERKDFLGRAFLIRGDRPEYAWRLTGEQGEYLGFACQKAVTEADSATVEAWFAPELPVSVGPASFGGLPGAILVLSIDRENPTTYSATHVSLDAPDEALIRAPEKGKVVTQEEFAAIRKEKLEEMQGRGGNRTVIRRIGRR